MTPPASEIVAIRLGRDISLNAAQMAGEWLSASPVSFSADWQGQNRDPRLETTVRALWSEAHLYVRFDCRFQELYVFPAADPNGRRDELWERDVAEVFLQPDPSQPRCYREFEISPNGFWIDLDIFPGGRSDLKSGMQSSVSMDEIHNTWSAELAIPFDALTSRFDPTEIWRANFYRIEGERPRRYLAWQPTSTPQPNFHVPDAFGRLRFST